MPPPEIPGFSWEQFFAVWPEQHQTFQISNHRFQNILTYMEMLDFYTHERIYNTYISKKSYNCTIGCVSSIYMLIHIYNKHSTLGKHINIIY